LLHFHSGKAYDFVHKEFNIILPHPRTLSKWYTKTDASPGFTNESLDTLTFKCKNTDNTIYCILVLDEMAIRKHVEWDDSNYHGYVNFGAELDSDQLDIANECLVFILVAINERWLEIYPVGYFLCKYLNSTQKFNLLTQCLDLVTKTGVVIVSVTFDGCSSNIDMTKSLGCSYYTNNLKTNFTINNLQPIVILPDPSHMIKLVRNCSGEKRRFVDNNNEVIDYLFNEKLNLTKSIINGHGHFGSSALYKVPASYGDQNIGSSWKMGKFEISLVEVK
jgi:hypothetical protein